VSWYQTGKTNLDFTEARDSEWQWHQLGRMQVCILLQTANHANTPPLSFLQAGCPSCLPTNSIKALKANPTAYPSESTSSSNWYAQFARRWYIFHTFFLLYNVYILRKENEAALQRAEMRIVRWMCGVQLRGPRPRARPKRTWREVVKKDCEARKLNTEDAVDRSKWRKLTKDVRRSGWV